MQMGYSYESKKGGCSIEVQMQPETNKDKKIEQFYTYYIKIKNKGGER